MSISMCSLTSFWACVRVYQQSRCNNCAINSFWPSASILVFMFKVRGMDTTATRLKFICIWNINCLVMISGTTLRDTIGISESHQIVVSRRKYLAWGFPVWKHFRYWACTHVHTCAHACTGSCCKNNIIATTATTTTTTTTITTTTTTTTTTTSLTVSSSWCKMLLPIKQWS